MVINHPRLTHYETWPLALPTMPCFYSCWRANSIFCLGRILTEASFTAISMWECWAFIPLLWKRYKHRIGGHFRSASKPAAEVGTKRHWRLCTQCKPAWQDRDVTFWQHVMCCKYIQFLLQRISKTSHRIHGPRLKLVLVDSFYQCTHIEI